MKLKYNLALILTITLFSISYQTMGVVSIINGLTHTHKGMKGDVITGIIKMKNDGKKQARMIFYQQDYFINCDLVEDFRDINSHEYSLGKFIKTSIDEKVLEPNEEYSMIYTITIPKDLPKEGSYWGMIMAESADPVREDQTKEGFKVGSKIRYAIQILTDIGNFDFGKISYEDITFKKTNDSTKSILIKLKNNCYYASKVKVACEIFNTKAEKVKVIDGIVKRVYPERCGFFRIDLKDIPPGKYEGIIVADNGKDLFGSNLSIAIE